MNNALHCLIIMVMVVGYVATLTIVLCKVTDAKLASGSDHSQESYVTIPGKLANQKEGN